MVDSNIDNLNGIAVNNTNSTLTFPAVTTDTQPLITTTFTLRSLTTTSIEGNAVTLLPAR